MGVESHDIDTLPDDYSRHLAQVNAVASVVATIDICNTQGQLLVAKGGAIDQRMCEKILRFKLSRPIEDSIAVENEFTAESLQGRLQLFLDMDPYLKHLKMSEPEGLLARCCEVFCRFALLRQKLTVLAIQLPIVFEQGLFCAWVGSVIMAQSSRDEGDCYTAFVAGLSHDFGMLHLHPDILNKPSALSPEEWRQIQAHPIIGSKILSQVPKLPPEVARAVLEHHENLDGTGYPRGKMGDALGRFGQMLNLLDSVNAIYRKHFKSHARSLRDIIPIIQMNNHSRFGTAANTLIILLKKLPENNACGVPAPLMNDFVIAVKARNFYLAACIEKITAITPQIGFRHQNPNIFAIQNAIIHITISIVQSGIINEAYMRWLDQVLAQKLEHAYREIEDVFIMMQEIIYHIDKLKNQIRAFLQFDADAVKLKFLEEVLEQLDKRQKPQLPPSLSNVWLAAMAG